MYYETRYPLWVSIFEEYALKYSLAKSWLSRRRRAGVVCQSRRVDVLPEFCQNPGRVGVDVAGGLDTRHRSAVDSKVYRVGIGVPEFWQNPGGVGVDLAGA